jgi:ABC-type cobalamin/Fe3+-siderophores transport system ATPase subunit
MIANGAERSMTDGLVRMHVQGLCSLEDVELVPGRLTVLIGPNGSGKSNVLRALSYYIPKSSRAATIPRDVVAHAPGASALGATSNFWTVSSAVPVVELSTRVLLGVSGFCDRMAAADALAQGRSLSRRFGAPVQGARCGVF